MSGRIKFSMGNRINPSMKNVTVKGYDFHLEVQPLQRSEETAHL
jgi:hypothetical protein